MVFITRVCPFCGEKMGLWVEEDGFNAWEGGVPVQKAFPDLSAKEWEFIISGICENCWEKMFGDEG